jgi:hypothetical protein
VNTASATDLRQCAAQTLKNNRGSARKGFGPELFGAYDRKGAEKADAIGDKKQTIS